MLLSDYMRLRNGLTRDGGIKFAMSRQEAFTFNIDICRKGWARKYKNTVIEDCKAKDLSSVYGKFNGPIKDTRFLYLIHNKHNNCCKIGISKDPKNRKRSLECSSGSQLELAAVWEVQHEAREVEKLVHSAFSSSRTVGEWFEGLISVQDLEKVIDVPFRRVLKRA